MRLYRGICFAAPRAVNARLSCIVLRLAFMESWSQTLHGLRQALWAAKSVYAGICEFVWCRPNLRACISLRILTLRRLAAAPSHLLARQGGNHFSPQVSLFDWAVRFEIAKASSRSASFAICPARPARATSPARATLSVLLVPSAEVFT